MSESEAKNLAELYRRKGRMVELTPSFQPGSVLVMVKLPVNDRHPRPSSIFQNRMWK